MTCAWSPDGRHFLTATVAPRLRVDNGFQIYRQCDCTTRTDSHRWGSQGWHMQMTLGAEQQDSHAACQHTIQCSAMHPAALTGHAKLSHPQPAPVRRYTGEKVHDERVEVLLEAVWRPAPAGAFPDLPQSPKANGAGAPAFTPPPAASGYVAPHLRGANGGLIAVVPLLLSGLGARKLRMLYCDACAFGLLGCACLAKGWQNI